MIFCIELNQNENLKLIQHWGRFDKVWKKIWQIIFVIFNLGKFNLSKTDCKPAQVVSFNICKNVKYCCKIMYFKRFSAVLSRQSKQWWYEAPKIKLHLPFTSTPKKLEFYKMNLKSKMFNIKFEHLQIWNKQLLLQVKQRLLQVKRWNVKILGGCEWVVGWSKSRVKDWFRQKLCSHTNNLKWQCVQRKLQLLQINSVTQ